MRLLAVFVALVLSLAGCGADDQPSTEPANDPSPTTSTEPATGSGGGIVGQWQRVTTCEERVQALVDAGLGDFAAEHAAGEGWIPGVTGPDQIVDPAHPCAGSVPLEHGHFFTVDGLFGSTDDQGEQVDDGTYRVLDEDTIVVQKEFGEVSFDYRIRGDDTLLLEPVLPACAETGCFAAQWAVAVAYPGLPWERVE